MIDVSVEELKKSFERTLSNCYIPESIRYALDYIKTKRGGIKLVSLLVQKFIGEKEYN